MKKWLLITATAGILSACSASNESKQVAGDTYQKSGEELPAFAQLASGGVHLPAESNEYVLPPVKIQRADNVDIRPPSLPLAIIPNSVTQFDGERALIAFPPEKQNVYNIKQIARLLKEQNIPFKAEGKRIETEWTNTGRMDDIGDAQIRYLIEEVNAPQANALFVLVLEMQRDGTIYTPDTADKQRYSSDRLNQLVGELNSTYRKQQQDLALTSIGAIQSKIAQDNNGQTALIMAASFGQAWEKLSEKLPHLGFESKEENPARGYREVKYSSEYDLGLEDGTYYLQLSTLGSNTAVVISDEEHQALTGRTAQSVYQALQSQLAQ